MEYTMLSFFITIYSLENNKSKENFERCFKNCFVLLDLQGEKHTIGSHNIQELEKMSRLPMHLMNLATDTYWTAWTFLIGHELFHLTNETEMPAYEEEMKNHVVRVLSIERFLSGIVRKRNTKRNTI